MPRRWVFGALAILCLLAVAFPLYRTVAGTRDTQGEHEALVYRGTTACGVERWWVKTGIDADAGLVNRRAVVSTNIIHLRSLPAPASLPLRSRIRPTETTVFSLRATLLRVKQEADSDYHLVIADSGGRTMIVEIPAPACVGSRSPFLSSIRSVRRTFDSAFSVNGSWHRMKVPVQVTGVGYFDFLHGQSGVAPNGIELHPVLSISFRGGSKQPGPSPLPVPQPKNTTPAPRPVAGFSVRAWVSPSSMPYGAHPTLYAQTTPGASCTASVIYSTGRRPVSFDGSAKTVGSSGTVSWSWHEETKGSGGEGNVTCTYRGQTKTAAASFIVTG